MSLPQTIYLKIWLSFSLLTVRKKNRNGVGRGPVVHKKIERHRIQDAERLHDDYFSISPVYNEELFKRGFRLSRSSFLRIFSSIQKNPYLKQCRDCTGKLGPTGLQKATETICVLVYGCAYDSFDEYLRLGASTIDKSAKDFAETVLNC